MALEQVLRCSITLNPAATGRDRIMNTWHIATRDGATPIQAADAFYTDINAFYQAIDSYLGADLSTAQPEMQVFNLIEVKPRQPIKVYNLTALTTAATRAAREVACCMSYRGVYESGVSPKRRRGRIFLGPLASTALDTSTGGLAGALVTAVQGAGDVLQAAAAGDAQYGWVVYSPTTDVVGTGETGFYEVISGWVDYNPDTQRRRSMTSAGRVTF